MSEREWRFYLDDMIDFAEKVLAYSAGLDQQAFIANGLNFDATVRNLEILGEAATHIPIEHRDARPSIPWRQIIGQRNVLIHEYGEIKQERIWKAVRENVPQLIELLKQFV